MAAITRWAESDGQLEKLGLFVFSTSEPAVGLYKKFGFRFFAQPEGQYPQMVLAFEKEEC